MSRIGEDLLAGFDDGRCLLAGGLPVTVSTLQAGTLVLTSGHVEARDPFFAMSAGAFARTVPRGRYPVLLSIARSGTPDAPALPGRVAMAMLRIEDTRPVRWELATREGEDVRQLAAGEFYGYPVDSALGAFLDADVSGRMLDVGDRIMRALEQTRSLSGGHGEVRVHGKSGANVVVFVSGWGDGVYGSWWGLAENGRPVCLITDFQVLDVARPVVADTPEARAEQVRDLMGRLRHADPWDSRQVLLSLGAYAGEAVEALGALTAFTLSSQREDSEWELAAWVLRRICEAAPEARVREALAEAFGGLQEPEPWKPLVWLLTSPVPEVHTSAARWLLPAARSAHEDLLQALADVIIDAEAEPGLRVRAIGSLEAFPRLTEPVRVALQLVAEGSEGALSSRARVVLRRQAGG